MPEPEANPAPSVQRRHRDPALLAVAVIAVGLGLGVGAGSVFSDTGTTASVSDAAFPGLIGGVVGALAGALALWMIRALSDRHWPTVRPFVITVVVCTAGLGVLSGVSMAPSEPVPGSVVSGGADTAFPTGSVAAAGVVVPVDRDADGEPDTFEGEPLLGFDIDDDNVADGFLRRCGDDPDPRVEEREGFLAIDLRCDSKVDKYLPLDDERILSVFAEEVVAPEDDEARVPANPLITIGLIVMLLMLLAALGFFLSQVALRAPPIKREFVSLSTNLTPTTDEPVDVDLVVDVLQASLDGVLSEADPRVAIRIAYGTLLDGLALLGLPRRPRRVRTSTWNAACGLPNSPSARFASCCGCSPSPASACIRSPRNTAVRRSLRSTLRSPASGGSRCAMKAWMISVAALLTAVGISSPRVVGRSGHLLLIIIGLAVAVVAVQPVFAKFEPRRSEPFVPTAPRTPRATMPNQMAQIVEAFTTRPSNNRGDDLVPANLLRRITTVATGRIVDHHHLHIGDAGDHAAIQQLVSPMLWTLLRPADPASTIAAPALTVPFDDLDGLLDELEHL